MKEGGSNPLRPRIQVDRGRQHDTLQFQTSLYQNSSNYHVSRSKEPTETHPDLSKRNKKYVRRSAVLVPVHQLPTMPSPKRRAQGPHQLHAGPPRREALWPMRLRHRQEKRDGGRQRVPHRLRAVRGAGPRQKGGRLLVEQAEMVSLNLNQENAVQQLIILREEANLVYSW